MQAIGQGLFGGLSCIRAEQSAAPDCLQRPLRSGFRQQVSASVGLQNCVWAILEHQPTQLAAFETMARVAVRALADRVLDGAPDAVESCGRCGWAETQGLWHGRGRALMCRRMKPVALSRAQRWRLVRASFQRLASGHFAEQCRDQRRLAIQVAQAAPFQVARCAFKSAKDSVRRLAPWVLSRKRATGDAQPSPGADAP